MSNKRIYIVEKEGTTYYGPCLAHICVYLSEKFGIVVSQKQMSDTAVLSIRKKNIHKGMRVTRIFPATPEDWIKMKSKENTIYIQ